MSRLMEQPGAGSYRVSDAAGVRVFPVRWNRHHKRHNLALAKAGLRVLLDRLFKQHGETPQVKAKLLRALDKEFRGSAYYRPVFLTVEKLAEKWEAIDAQDKWYRANAGPPTLGTAPASTQEGP